MDWKPNAHKVLGPRIEPGTWLVQFKATELPSCAKPLPSFLWYLFICGILMLTTMQHQYRMDHSWISPAADPWYWGFHMAIGFSKVYFFLLCEKYILLRATWKVYYRPHEKYTFTGHMKSILSPSQSIILLLMKSILYRPYKKYTLMGSFEKYTLWAIWKVYFIVHMKSIL